MKKHLVFSSLMYASLLPAFAQGIVSNGAKWVITSGAHLRVQGAASGNFTHLGGSEINNNGTIHLEGDWSNQSTGPVFVSTDAVGTVEMNSSALQKIEGTQATRFENLTLVGSDKRLEVTGNEVVGVLTLDANLDLNSKELLVQNGSVSAITRLSGHIYSESTDAASKLTWKIGSSTGAHVFPMGTFDSEYIPFTFDLFSGDAGSVSLATYPTNTSLIPYASGVSDIDVYGTGDNSPYSIKRWWINSSSAGDPSLSAELKFTYGDADIPVEGEDNLKAVRYEGDWLAPLTSQLAAPAANRVTVSDVSKTGVWLLSANKNGGASGLKEELEKQLVVYESAGNLNLILPKGVKVSRLELFTLTGQAVASSQEQSLDVSSISCGVYLLNLVCEDIVLSKKVYIQ